MPIFIQPSFSRGELSTFLHGRVDTAAYQVGLRTAFNVTIHDSGGASNRAGLEFIGPVKDHTKTVRLIPFKFKTSDTYTLEFGDLYMRVIRDDSHIAEAAKTITGITKANPAVVSSTAHGYVNGDEVALTGIVGMVELNGRRVVVANKNANDFEITDQVTGANIDTTGYVAYVSNGSAFKVFEITTPYAEADLELLKYSQSADVVTITHPTYQPREVRRTDHDAWTITEPSYFPRQAAPTALIASQNGATGAETYKYKVTAIADETFEESLPAANNASKTITGASKTDPVVIDSVAHGFLDRETIEITAVVGMTELNNRRFTLANKNDDDFELKGEDGSDYTAWSADGTMRLTLVKVTDGNATLSETDNIAVSWAEAANAQRYAIYKEVNGLYGLLGETEELTFTDDGTASPDLTSTPPRVREPFRGTDNAPSSVGYYQQRRIFGGANNRPDTSDLSRTGDQSNFTMSTPAKADDALRVTLTSLEVNEIRHYVPLDDLLILTSGEEWRIDSGDSNRLSIDTLRQKPQTTWGSSHRRPIKLGRIVLFVQENNSIVRSIGFELSVDGFTGTDMSLLASHIFRDFSIVDWGGGKTPDPITYLVRADGQAATMTFNPEQEVIAWTQWATRPLDKFENVAVSRPTVTSASPPPDIGEGTISSALAAAALDDAPYFVVKRRINGQVVRYIERLHSRRFTDVRDCFFVDCGLTFDNPVAVTGVSLANPVILTIASGHGLVADDEVDVDDIIWAVNTDEFDTVSQPDQLNRGRFKVGAATSTTITLLDLDDSTNIDGAGFNAYIEDGVVRKAVDTLSGFHHLAGETAIALADGSVIRDLTVSATGTVALPRKFSRVHLGFGYFSDIETLNIEAPSAGTVQGQLKNVHQLIARVDRTRGLWAGPTAADLVEISQRQFEPYGEPTELFTGDIEIDLPPLWNSNGRVYLRQRDPLPLTLLALVPRFEMEGLEEEEEEG